MDWRFALGGVEDFSPYNDMIEATDLVPTYGLRVIVGLDYDGVLALCINQVGTIDGVTLLGVLEALKHRLLEA